MTKKANSTKKASSAKKSNTEFAEEMCDHRTTK